MGVHHAPQPSSHAARLAGRGALTAAAALALAGGTASLAFASEAPSVPTTQDIPGHATDVSGATKNHASDMKDKAADAGHMADNTKNDLSHAATNWSAAAKGGLTPAEGAAQTKLMANDVQHAVDNGRNDVTHRSGSLSGGAPELPSVLSFS